jgi:hypothetical protein
LSWTTAYQLLHRAARVQQGQRVLVHGAAGAVGQALLVLGRLAGLELWGGARGAHAALIRELGATPIDTQREDLTRILPGGFDVVFDGVGKDGFGPSLAAVKPGGRLCAYGYAADVKPGSRMLAILMWIGYNIQPGSSRIWGGFSACWRSAPFAPASRSGSLSTMSPRHTVASRRVASMAGSSCAQTSLRDATRLPCSSAYPAAELAHRAKLGSASPRVAPIAHNFG